MNKFIKGMFIFLSLFVVMFIYENVSAFTITSEPTGLYFTFTKENGHRFSDEARIYYVDGRIAYCIEPGIAMGSSGYYQGDLSSLPEAKRKRIEKLMYYGYGYRNNNIYAHYLATQKLIWEELLPEGNKVTFSTELFEKGVIRDISIYVDFVENAIKDNAMINNYNDSYDIPINEPIVIRNINLFKKTDYFDYTYDSNDLDVSIDNYKFLSITGKTIGKHNIEIKEKDVYNTPYIVYKNDTKQDLLVVGSIELNKKNILINVTAGQVIINKEDLDTYELLPGATYGLYNKNNELICELTTDESGTMSTDNNISYGIYYLKELKAPEGYELNNYKSYIQLDENNKIINITLLDKKIEGNLTIIKYDKDTNEVIPDTEFNILDNDNNIIDTIKTNNEGKANIKLKYGKYHYQEVKVNDNYELDNTIYDIDIDESIDYIRSVYNTKIPTEDELVIEDVPNTNIYSIMPLILIIGVIIVQKEINYYILNC